MAPLGSEGGSGANPPYRQKKHPTICCRQKKAGTNDVYGTIDNDKYKSDI